MTILTHRRATRVPTAIVALAALALVAAACSSSGDGLTIEAEVPAGDDATTAGDPAPPASDGETFHPEEIVFERITFAAGATGTTVSGTIEPATIDGWVAQAAAGQTMTLSLVAFDGTASFVLSAPDSTTLGSGTDLTVQLPLDGDYFIVVSGSDMVAYDLTIRITSPADAPAPPPDPGARRNPGGVYGDYGIYERVSFAAGATSATVSGGVVTGTVNGYLIGAAAGQTMDLVLTSDTGGLMDVYAPDDSPLATGTQSFSTVLPATGDYLVVVSRTAGNATYDLSISIQ